MSAVCPNGHTSESEDYCDTCGAPIAEGAVSPAPSGGTGAGGSGNSLDLDSGSGSEPAEPEAPEGKVCPNCQTLNTPDSLFCEACGYDFTTGALPAGATPPEGESAPVALAAPGGGEEGPHSAEPESEGVPESASPDLGSPDPGALDPDSHDPGSADPGSPDPGSPDPGSPDLGSPGLAGDPDVGPDPDAASADPGAWTGSTGSGGVPPRIPFQWVAEVWIDPDWYADQQATDPLPSAGLPVVVPLRVASALIGRRSASRNINPDIDCSADPGVSRRHAQLTTDGSRWFVEDLQSSNGTFVGPASGPLPDDPIQPGPKTEVGDSRIYVGAWTRIVVRRATDEEIAVG